MDAAPAPIQKRKFRWYRFSLRSLLIFIMIFAIACSWFTVKMQQAKKQRDAAAALRKFGSVLYGYDLGLGDGQFEEAKPPRPVWLNDFFDTVKAVYFNNHAVTDADLDHLKELRQIETLNFDYTQITDKGLEQIEELENLETLGLSDTQITDTGLNHLKKLKQLQFIVLSGTKITDVGLEHLKELSRLMHLELGNTQITDKGLEHLKGLNQLKMLELRGTQVTNAGIAELQKVLPNCYIFY